MSRNLCFSINPNQSIAGTSMRFRPPTVSNDLCIYFFFFFVSIGLASSATLVSYDEANVWNYLRLLPRENVSAKCASSLDKVETYLTDKATLDEERQFFYQSYGTGDASQFTSRDQDRWIYRAFE